jgi:hypothetical protein
MNSFMRYLGMLLPGFVAFAADMVSRAESSSGSEDKFPGISNGR